MQRIEAMNDLVAPMRRAIAKCNEFIMDRTAPAQEGVEPHRILGELFIAFVDALCEDDEIIELPRDVDEVRRVAKGALSAISSEIYHREERPPLKKTCRIRRR